MNRDDILKTLANYLPDDNCDFTYSCGSRHITIHWDDKEE